MQFEFQTDVAKIHLNIVYTNQCSQVFVEFDFKVYAQFLRPFTNHV